ncbi:MAG TPA: ATP-binding protein [Actinobacteria bacterium]|nr:ATP-binding protein [Actinomycetota bacterium]
MVSKELDKSCKNCGDEGDCPEENPQKDVKCCLAVMSGKGGVGKSLVTGLMAVALKNAGLKIGILDADLTGPSIPKMFGINKKAKSGDGKIIPIESLNGIKIMSLNLLLDREDDAVIWRGPVIAGAIKQFWTDVAWGELDCLLIDLPPGTADAPLTVMQSIPLDGVIVVSSPQDLAVMIVKKALQMTRKLNIPTLGLIENMSYAHCPKCGEKIDFFGESNISEITKDYKIDLLAEIPIDPQIAKLCDEGKIEDYDVKFLDKAKNNVEKILKDKN